VNFPENSTNPSLVRLLEQLTLYGAALHHANSPVLARLMENSAEFLRTQNELIVALRSELRLLGRESSRVAATLEPVPASSPSKPAALNTKNTTANPSRSPARKSIATPIQGRSEEQ